MVPKIGSGVLAALNGRILHGSPEAIFVTARKSRTHFRAVAGLSVDSRESALD